MLDLLARHPSTARFVSRKLAQYFVADDPPPALVERMAERGEGDGVADIGGPLTAQFICEQLGFDWAEVGTERVAIWTKAVLDQIAEVLAGFESENGSGAGAAVEAEPYP